MDDFLSTRIVAFNLRHQGSTIRMELDAIPSCQNLLVECMRTLQFDMNAQCVLSYERNRQLEPINTDGNVKTFASQMRKRRQAGSQCWCSNDRPTPRLPPRLSLENQLKSRSTSPQFCVVVLEPLRLKLRDTGRQPCCRRGRQCSGDHCVLLRCSSSCVSERGGCGSAGNRSPLDPGAEAAAGCRSRRKQSRDGHSAAPAGRPSPRPWIKAKWTLTNGSRS